VVGEVPGRQRGDPALHIDEARLPPLSTGGHDGNEQLRQSCTSDVECEALARRIVADMEVEGLGKPRDRLVTAERLDRRMRG
jgi:hypothetical protein